MDGHATRQTRIIKNCLSPQDRATVAVKPNPGLMTVEKLHRGRVGNAIHQNKIRISKFQHAIRIHRPGLGTTMTAGGIRSEQQVKVDVDHDQRITCVISAVKTEQKM